MILYCGVTKEEIKQDGVCVDLLIDGGKADEQLNIYHLKSWTYLLEKYKTFDYIFIDGGIFGNFDTIKIKEKIINIIQKICEKGLIIYGEHLLRRFNIEGICKGEDLLQRKQNLPFTYIPIQQYTMKNFDLAYNKSSLFQRMQKIRVITEYQSKF